VILYEDPYLINVRISLSTEISEVVQDVNLSNLYGVTGKALIYRSPTVLDYFKGHESDMERGNVSKVVASELIPVTVNVKDDRLSNANHAQLTKLVQESVYEIYSSKYS
jgi:hypothetical protein